MNENIEDSVKAAITEGQAAANIEDDPVPAIQTAPLNTDLSRKIVSEIQTAASRAYRVEVILVGVASLLLVLITGLSALNTFRLRSQSTYVKGAADRIVDCTTAGHPCYDQQQQQSQYLVADVLIQLNQEHFAIECILKNLPSARTDAFIMKCRDEAKAQTDKQRAELKAQLNASTTTTTTTR